MTITNTGGPITSGGMGLYGHARAYGNGAGVKGYGGHATATTTISNTDAINSSGDGIHGNSRGYANGYGSTTSGGLGVGGVAVGGVTITNSGGAAITSTNRGGIYGYVLVEATGGDLHSPGGHNRSYTAVGGTATGNVNISNTGAINNTNNGAPKHSGDGIYGHVKAFAGGYGLYDVPTIAGPGGSGTGGSAIAGVVITNSVGGTISSTGGEGIDGYARAKAKGSGFAAFGGQATATTTITNSAPITTTTWNDGIYGGAKAFAGAFGAYTAPPGTFPGGSGVGGTAIAGLVITNNADSPISNAGHRGIDGYSYANALAKGFTAVGGVASATTSISNSSALTSGWNDAIRGRATALAGGYGPIGGSATGGTAVAAVAVNNATADATLFSLEYMGIDAQSSAHADAGASGKPVFTAFGGTATATTTITNAAEIAVEQNGIYGSANASADAFGATTTSGSATGGTAVAGVTITNSGKIWDVQVPDDGGGIRGTSVARANAYGFTAQGGAASATTTIVNTPQINSFQTAIYGSAKTYANAKGVDIKGSIAQAGIAIANLLITNGTADALSSVNGSGIDGVVGADANAGSSGTRSYTATGGTASASLSIDNSSSIVSSSDGIRGEARASANAFGSNTFTAYSKGQTAAATSYSYGACDDDPVLTCKTHTYPAVSHIDATLFSSGSATGGTAVADVVITNNTGGTITSINNEGIDGYASAAANANGFLAFGGVASATTTITNGPPINSHGTGIAGTSKAYANGVGQYGHSYSYSGTGTGGTAVAAVVISNGTADAISSINGEGIDGYALARANAEGYIALGGTASASTDITNAASIRSWNTGIAGTAKADANADTSGSAGHSATGGTANAACDDHQQHRRHHLEPQRRGHRRLRGGQGRCGRFGLHGHWRRCDRHHHDCQLCGDHEQIRRYPRSRAGKCERLWIVHSDRQTLAAPAPAARRSRASSSPTAPPSPAAAPWYRRLRQGLG